MLCTILAAMAVGGMLVAGFFMFKIKYLLSRGYSCEQIIHMELK